MPSNTNAYMTLEEAGDYYDRLYAIRRPADVFYTTTDSWEYEEAKKALFDCRATTLGGTYGFVTNIKPWMSDDGTPVFGINIKPTGAQRAPFDVTTHKLEDHMKVYEGIIVKMDEQNQPAEVLMVVAPFIAKDAETAVNTIRVDYAAQSKLSGKDAAALRVRVREFPLG